MPTHQIDALCKHVERLGRQHPPIPVLTTPGYVWVDPPQHVLDDHYWSSKLRRRERHWHRVCAFLGGFAGVSLALAFWHLTVGF